MPLAPPANLAADLAPLQLPPDLRLSVEQFAAVCAANPQAVLELSADGQLIQMTPTGGETGARNQTLGALLWIAVRSSGLPFKLFDSSTGFRLRDGSVFSPDASLVHLERWQALTPEQRRKMGAYQANGAQLDWLLIREQQAVEIWPASGSSGATPQRLEAATMLDAGPLFPGLGLDLQEIWQA
ncbi:MAG: Uma2 family endonuclease [Synechococcaceae cyanobacterium]